MAKHARTRNQFVAEAAGREDLYAETVGDLFHKCQTVYGCCIGRLVNMEAENPVWRFARCEGRYESCKTSIVDVTVYWEGK